MGQSAQKPTFTPFGSLFEPIGFIGGKPVWPVLGGNGEGEGGDGTQGGAGENASGTGQSAGDGNENGNGSDGTGQGSGDGDGQRPVTREEFDRLRAQLSAADKNKAQAEKDLTDARAKLKEFEDKDRTELERAQNDLAEATKRSTELETKLRDFQIIEAFRAASDDGKLSWHNTKVAMQQLDSELYKIEDDGSVTGMDKAVKALAKDHEYLLKKDAGNGGGGKTGGSYNNGSGGGQGPQTDRKALSGKYPALRGRGGNQ